MRVLITGAAGNLGSGLTERLEGHALYRALADWRGVAIALADPRLVVPRIAPERAAVLLAEGKMLERALGDRVRAAHALADLGLDARDRGEIDRAERFLAGALTLGRDLGRPYVMHVALEGLATTAARLGVQTAAARLLGAADAHRTATGGQQGDAARKAHELAVEEVRVALGEVGFVAAYTAGRTLLLEAAVAEALAQTDGLTDGAVDA